MLSRMMDPDPSFRISVDELREHDWITQDGIYPIDE
jgi:serine/threonine protein kinase